MSADSGGFVFPANFTVGNVSRTEGGMTLRDWFAGQALNGILPARDPQGRNAFNECDPGQIAEWAYRQADAMLAARAEVAP